MNVSPNKDNEVEEANRLFSIRKKAIIIMCGCLLLVLTLGYVATQFVLMPSYLALEDQMARENVTRVLNALRGGNRQSG